MSRPYPQIQLDHAGARHSTWGLAVVVDSSRTHVPAYGPVHARTDRIGIAIRVRVPPAGRRRSNLSTTGRAAAVRPGGGGIPDGDGDPSHDSARPGSRRALVAAVAPGRVDGTERGAVATGCVWRFGVAARRGGTEAKGLPLPSALLTCRGRTGRCRLTGKGARDDCAGAGPRTCGGARAAPPGGRKSAADVRVARSPGK
jgi:hypothetical protein